MIVFAMLLIGLISLILVFIFLYKIILFIFTDKLFPKKIYSAMLCSIILFIALYTYHNYFFSFNRIDFTSIQTQHNVVTSPNNTYSVQVFYEPYGGAAGGVNVFVELIDHEQNNVTKIIYYSDAKQKIILQWIDDDTLSIINEDSTFVNSNRSITLNVATEIYHEVGLACQSLLLKNSFEKCYQNE